MSEHAHMLLASYPLGFFMIVASGYMVNEERYLAALFSFITGVSLVLFPTLVVIGVIE